MCAASRQLTSGGVACSGQKFHCGDAFPMQVHDIEDLVKVGRSMGACPYFAARHFKGAYSASRANRLPACQC